MKACSACGRPARPVAMLLLLAPVGAGAVGALVLMAAKGTAHQRTAVVAVGAIFAVLAAGLLAFGLRVVNGRACPGCARSR